MGRVFVAGSINMDVVATAERHPRIGETVAGNAVLYFPGGKGANQAVAAAKLGARTTLIGRLGKDAFGDELKAFLAAQGIDLLLRARKPPGPHRHGDHHDRQCRQHHCRHSRRQCAGERRRRHRAHACEGRHRGQPVRDSPARDPSPSFERARAAGATTILNPAPAREFDRELLDLVDILILNETELGLLARPSFATPTMTLASSRPPGRCQSAGTRSSA